MNKTRPNVSQGIFVKQILFLLNFSASTRCGAPALHFPESPCSEPHLSDNRGHIQLLNSFFSFFLFQSFNLVIRDVTLPVCKKLYPWKHLSGYMGRIHKTLCKKPNLHKQSLWEENKQKKPLQTLCSWLLLLKFCISLPLIPHILLFSPFWISIHAFYHRFHFVLSCLARYVLTHNRLWTDDTLGWFICC